MLKKIVSIIMLAGIMLATFSAAAHAQDEEKTVLRVGIPADILSYSGGQNSIKKYTYDYLDAVSQYTGWEYEEVAVEGTLQEQTKKLSEMLKNNEIDLMGNMLYNPQNSKDYSYSSNSYATKWITLVALPEAYCDVSCINVSVNQNITVAVEKDDKSLVNKFEDYCEMNRITPAYIECSDSQEVMKALKNRRADYALSESDRTFREYSTVASFYPSQIYFAFSNSAAEKYMEDLNGAMYSITQSMPYFQNDLFEKYFTPRVLLKLTKKDRELVASLGETKIGVLKNQPPYQYSDAKTGEFSGIAIEFIKKIAGEIDMKYCFVEAESQEQLANMAESGEIDMIACMSSNTTFGGRTLFCSTPYITAQYVTIMNSSVDDSDFHGKTLAISRWRSYGGYYIGNPKYYDDFTECVEAVRSAEADYTYVDSYAAQYYLNLPKYKDMQFISLSGFSKEICIGMRKDYVKELLPIINKGIFSISDEEVQEILLHNVTYSPDEGFLAFLSNNIVYISVMAIISLIAIAAIMWYGLNKQKKTANALDIVVQKHQQIFEISKDIFFEYDYSARKINFSDSMKSKEFYDEYVGNEDGEIHSALLDVITSGFDGIKDIKVVLKDGSPCWLRITCKTGYDESGHLLYTVGLLADVNDEKRELGELMLRAQRDSLTQLYNSKTVSEKVGEALEKLDESSHGAILLIDIDHFKDVNDAYGHMQGDDILKSVSLAFNSAFYNEGIVGRLGGDEFVIYLECIEDKECLHEFCDMICRLARSIPLGVGSNVTVSIGACMSSKGDTFDSLYQTADDALYIAKANGRDQFYIL